MSATTTISWVPTTVEDQELQDAVITLNASNDRALVDTPAGANDPKQFILHSKGYYDLQAYVMSGKTFPQNDAAFTALMPRDSFTKLTTIDSTIYDKTKDTMVAIGSTCQDFHTNHLAKLVNAGSIAQTYSESTIELLADAKDLNLRYQLDILMDSKYAVASAQDQAFKEAREGATMVLNMLSGQAKQNSDDIREIVKVLLVFKDNTIQNVSGVDYLIKQYQTGPVENSSDEKTPYLEYLNADLKAKTDQFEAAVRNAAGTYSQWQEATGAAVGFVFAGIFGWIAMIYYSVHAANLRAAYNTLQEQIKTLEQDRREETALINNVRMLITQFDNIEDKMKEAIKAMTELALLFDEQAASYTRIAGYLDGMKTGASAAEYRNRKVFIQYNLDQAITKLRQLGKLAKEFKETIITQTSLDHVEAAQ
ncbi:hypothetical protein BDZ85DRAFT_280695 [Elsinoe ampelina]|uniref:Uncharacterized protein n=1 Tax=Elsinoe ampelina TaxID=302913 RepID=A0A6A6GEE0_9PEZI|nr:hypothetical protein BDZ85DRAFT_280695 [Elsinoe ampelina]